MIKISNISEFDSLLIQMNDEKTQNAIRKILNS